MFIGFTKNSWWFLNRKNKNSQVDSKKKKKIASKKKRHEVFSWSWMKSRKNKKVEIAMFRSILDENNRRFSKIVFLSFLDGWKATKIIH